MPICLYAPPTHSAAFWTGLEGEFGGAPRLPGLPPLLSRSLTRGSRDWRERPWLPARQPVRRWPPTRFNRLADGCGMPTTPCPAEAGVIGAGHRRPPPGVVCTSAEPDKRSPGQAGRRAVPGHRLSGRRCDRARLRAGDQGGAGDRRAGHPPGLGAILASGRGRTRIARHRGTASMLKAALPACAPGESVHRTLHRRSCCPGRGAGRRVREPAQARGVTDYDYIPHMLPPDKTQLLEAPEMASEPLCGPAALARAAAALHATTQLSGLAQLKRAVLSIPPSARDFPELPARDNGALREPAEVRG